MATSQPKKQMRWDRVIMALLLLGGLIAGVIILIKR
jgi:hypothetical protein